MVFINKYLKCKKIVDLLIPIQDSNSPSLVLGTMGCLKVILPHINNSENEHEIKDSFGARKEVNETPFAIDRLLQVMKVKCILNFYNVLSTGLRIMSPLSHGQ